MVRTVTADTDGIATAAETVRDGGTIIYPTETCYGRGGDALERVDGSVVQELYLFNPMICNL